MNIKQMHDYIDFVDGKFKDRGYPYGFNHSYFIAKTLLEGGREDLFVPALFHDVLEDTETSEYDLRKLGIGDRELALVRQLTRKPNEVYLDFVTRLTGDAMIIKYLDLMFHLSHEPKSTLVPRYKNASEYLRKSISTDSKTWVVLERVASMVA